MTMQLQVTMKRKNKNGDPPTSWYIPEDVANIPDPTIRETKRTIVENNPRCRPCGTSSSSCNWDGLPITIGPPSGPDDNC